MVWRAAGPGGYRVNDADQHGNLSRKANRAPSNTNTVADGGGAVTSSDSAGMGEATDVS